MRTGTWSGGQALLAVLSAAVLAACGSSDDQGGSTRSGGSGRPTANASAGEGDHSPQAALSEPWHDDVRAAAGPGTRVGDGDPCPLPATLGVPEGWTPKAGNADLGLGCEIDGKPAGVVGFVRVWVSDLSDGDPKAVLEAKVADDPNAHDPQYREATVGGASGWELTYVEDLEDLDEHNRVRSFAVTAGDTVVRVDLDVIGDDYFDGLPAYLLARQSLTVHDG